MFSDMEIIGIPHIITVGAKGLNQGVIEYKKPSYYGKGKTFAVADAVASIKAKLGLN